MFSLTGYLSRQSNFAILGIAAASIFLTGGLDLATGVDLRLSIFYVLPIVLVNWYVRPLAAAGAALLAAVVWHYVDTMLGVTYSHPWMPYFNIVLWFASYSVLIIFLTKLRNAFETQKVLSRTDALTGVMNRPALVNQIALEIERARRHSHPLTLAYIDIDNFKEVNDSYGHKRGDALLQAVAKTLKGNLRAIDGVARVGGDEFVLLLPETNGSSAAVLARRLKDKLLAVTMAGQLKATYSFGVATFLKPPASIEEAIEAADRLMYAAKRGGKNMIKQEFFDNNG